MHTARQPARGGEAASPHEFTTTEQLRQHYKAVRARIRGASAKPVAVIPPLKQPEPEPEPVPETPVAEPEPLPVEPEVAADVPVVADELEAIVRSRNDILRAVAVAAQLSLTELRSHLRSRPLVNARFVYYVLARVYSGASLPQIGHIVGYRDHTTVMHGLRMGAERFNELAPIYRAACEKLDVPVPDVTRFLGGRR